MNKCGVPLQTFRKWAMRFASLGITVGRVDQVPPDSKATPHCNDNNPVAPRPPRLTLPRAAGVRRGGRRRQGRQGDGARAGGGDLAVHAAPVAGVDGVGGQAPAGAGGGRSGAAGRVLRGPQRGLLPRGRDGGRHRPDAAHAAPVSRGPRGGNISLGDANISLGDANSSLGDTNSSLGGRHSSPTPACRRTVTPWTTPRAPLCRRASPCIAFFASCAAVTLAKKPDALCAPSSTSAFAARVNW
jgi:hypothetical protein